MRVQCSSILQGGKGDPDRTTQGRRFEAAVLQRNEAGSASHQSARAPRRDRTPASRDTSPFESARDRGCGRARPIAILSKPIASPCVDSAIPEEDVMPAAAGGGKPFHPHLPNCREAPSESHRHRQGRHMRYPRRGGKVASGPRFRWSAASWQRPWRGGSRTAESDPSGLTVSRVRSEHRRCPHAGSVASCG